MKWETAAAIVAVVGIIAGAAVRIFKRPNMNGRHYVSSGEFNLLKLRLQTVQETADKVEQQVWGALKRIELSQKEMRAEIREDIKSIKRDVSLALSNNHNQGRG